MQMFSRHPTKSNILLIIEKVVKVFFFFFQILRYYGSYFETVKVISITFFAFYDCLGVLCQWSEFGKIVFRGARVNVDKTLCT